MIAISISQHSKLLNSTFSSLFHRTTFPAFWLLEERNDDGPVLCLPSFTVLLFPRVFHHFPVWPWLWLGLTLPRQRGNRINPPYYTQCASCSLVARQPRTKVESGLFLLLLLLFLPWPICRESGVNIDAGTAGGCTPNNGAPGGILLERNGNRRDGVHKYKRVNITASASWAAAAMVIHPSRVLFAAQNYKSAAEAV